MLKAVDDDRSRPGYVLALAGTRAEVIDLAEKVEETLQIRVEQ